jgi:hypothetical protein
MEKRKKKEKKRKKETNTAENQNIKMHFVTLASFAYISFGGLDIFVSDMTQHNP